MKPVKKKERLDRRASRQQSKLSQSAKKFIGSEKKRDENEFNRRKKRLIKTQTKRGKSTLSDKSFMGAYKDGMERSKRRQ